MKCGLYFASLDSQWLSSIAELSFQYKGDYLKLGGVVVWDTVSTQVAVAAPHDVSTPDEPWREEEEKTEHKGTISFLFLIHNYCLFPATDPGF